MKPSTTVQSETASSSSSSSSTTSQTSFTDTHQSLSSSSSSLSLSAAEEPVGGSRESSGHEAVTVDRRNDFSAVCRWTVTNFPKAKARALWSRYFEVGGYDCRLLVYPKGDSQALPGYFSIYLQIMDPRGSGSSKWDCFASYRLSIVNHGDELKSISRDSWHRFSTKKKSHGWCDFTPVSTILDSKSGFLINGDSLVITADILILNEYVSFSRDNNELQSSLGAANSGGISVPVLDVLSGKFTWKVRNFSLFKEMIKTQKIMSPIFPAGECNLRISVYQSSVNSIEYLSMCLESKDTDKSTLMDRSCWCLFRMSVLNQKQGMNLNHMHRDSYGRFAADNKSGDNTSLGWNDYMKMVDFIGPESGFLVDDTAVFSASFHVIKETSNFSKNGGLLGARNNGGVRKSDGYFGKFTWRIENFTRLKDLLKKRKITGLCIKSRRFQIGNRDCRLIVYPRGQSQPPCHLSVFLEVTDSRNTASDWSCFVSHRLSVVNQRMEEKSVAKESQNRYSKAAKDWGWREFVTLTSLFDQDSGFLVQDTVVFSAEVLILKETSTMQGCYDHDTELGSNTNSQTEASGKRGLFTWKVENFLSFKEIMETRKIFSKFFQAGGCELRIGVYESFDTICIYLESDQSGGSDLDKNFWVRYRMAVVNQKSTAKTVWKESSICTKTWNNSVLQFMKVSDMLEADAGFLLRDTVVFVCEIMDCCPWFEFADLEVFASEDEQDPLSTDPGDLIDSEDSEGISGDEEDMFRNLLARAGFHLTYGDNPSQPQVTLREKLLMDAGAIAGFLTGLRVYLDDPAKVKRLLLPTKLSSGNSVKKEVTGTNESSPSLMNLLMGVKVLQQAIIDLLLDIMVECCQPPEGSTADDLSDTSSAKPSPDVDVALSPSESRKREGGATESGQIPVYERLDSGGDERTNAYAVQSSDMIKTDIAKKTLAGQPISPPETSAGGPPLDSSFLRPSKTKWPEQSEELLGLIVNSLRALDGVVPQGCPEPRRRPPSAHKIALVLDRAPKHLQPDLVALIPKLVDQSEHQLAACALLDRLQKLDAEPSLRLPVLGALSQLEFGTEIWERVLFQCFKLLMDSHDEPLAAAMTFMFRAASQCQHLSQAVRVVRAKLKWLGSEVSSSVLDVLSKTVNTWVEVAEAILRDIDSDCDLDYSYAKVPYDLLVYSENGFNAENCCHFSDAYILMELLCIPSLTDEACQAFERAVSRGHIDNHLMSMVLERRIAQPLNSSSAEEGKTNGSLPFQEVNFTPVLVLAESLALSRDPQVQEFVRVLYATLFRLYEDDGFRGRLLKGLVDRATSTVDNCREADLDFDILSFLIREEDGVARPVLSMMREIAELANVDRAALWHQLCASEDENIRAREEMQAQISNMAKDKAILLQKLGESEAATNRLKSEMKAETDRFSREKKELSEQIQEGESQLEWIRSERDEEIARLSSEKKILRDHLHDCDSQLSQLKSRKRDELKRVVKEKNTLAERLKSAEAARKRFDEELKRCATETATREEVRKSLEDEVRRLTQAVGQTEEEKREKEEQVTRCEAYIDGMEAKLNACQQYIHTLESSLQEEMSRHAPLYGAGLEALSMKELETLSRIHEEGLRQIHSLQHRKGNIVGNPLLSPHSHGLYPNPAAHMAIGLPPHPNGVGLHNNGHVNGAAPGPWFNPT
ncbi:hypothetical protein GIB67_014920 [Kingdonia uniflora]|uniref:MATH domain-containing protein n=1 Tax=Kingdonia uniflora TaxID=39325 RepID=A0A7J7MTB5_9MAGN|nr:hypothetical protein GIB67_014920 [Kingdonia uniflora]